VRGLPKGLTLKRRTKSWLTERANADAQVGRRKDGEIKGRMEKGLLCVHLYNGFSEGERAAEFRTEKCGRKKNMSSGDFT